MFKSPVELLNCTDDYVAMSSDKEVENYHVQDIVNDRNCSNIKLHDYYLSFTDDNLVGSVNILGDNYDYSVKTYDHVLDLYKTEYNNNVLHYYYDEDFNIEFDYIQMYQIFGLNLLSCVEHFKTLTWLKPHDVKCVDENLNFTGEYRHITIESQIFEFYCGLGSNFISHELYTNYAIKAEVNDYLLWFFKKFYRYNISKLCRN